MSTSPDIEPPKAEMFVTYDKLLALKSHKTLMKKNKIESSERR